MVFGDFPPDELERILVQLPSRRADRRDRQGGRRHPPDRLHLQQGYDQGHAGDASDPPAGGRRPKYVVDISFHPASTVESVGAATVVDLTELLARQRHADRAWMPSACRRMIQQVA
jgi:hypothetical protein